MDYIFPKPVARLSPHAENIFSVAYSPDGKYLASGGSGGTVRIWDAATHEQLNCFIEHHDAVTVLEFMPDGEGLWSGSEDGTARLWSIKSGQQRACFDGYYRGVTGLAMLPDGNTLVAGGKNGDLDFWNLRSRNDSFHRTMDGPISDICTAHDGQVLAIVHAGEKHYDRFPNVEPATLYWHHDDGEPAETSEFPGTICAAASANAVVYAGSGPLLGFEDENLCDDHPTEEELANGTYARAICLYDVTDCPVNRLAQWGLWNEPFYDWWSAHHADILALAFSPSGHLLASASCDKSVRLWGGLTDGSHDLLQIFKGHTTAVRDVAFSPNGRTLASAGDNSVLIWPLTD